MKFAGRENTQSGDSKATLTIANYVLLTGSNEGSELHVLEPMSGAQLHRFKSCRVSRFGAVDIPRTQHLVAVQDNRLAMHIYQWSKDVPVYKFHTAEKMGAICASSCGNYVFAGAQFSGKIYVWDVKTGDLLSIWDAHYKKVNAIVLTSDDSHLITAGDDAIVHAWPVADVLDISAADIGFQEGIKPHISWSDHALPVTSVYVGIGDVKARVFTTSLDRTCKIWALHSSDCLFSISLPSSTHICIANRVEEQLYIGCEDSNIYTVHLHAAAESRLASQVQLASSDPKDTHNGFGSVLKQNAFSGHEEAITAMQISACGNALISGSKDGSIRVWDVSSGQCVTTFRLFKTAISLLRLVLRPQTLQNGHEEHECMTSRIPIAPFKKFTASNARCIDS